jgi:transposase-like protein
MGRLMSWTGCSPAVTLIILCVRWYVRYKLSLRDLVEMIAERVLSLAHTTIMRWVMHFTPE